jgi:predicted nucleic acid-binding protein
MRVSLDANILVYALQAEERRHKTARDLVARAIVADCVQTLQSLAECFNALVPKRSFEPSRAMAEVERFKAAFPVEAAQPADLDRAMWATMHHRFAFWDAMLWATARRAGCRVLLSGDGHDGRDLEGVTFINPFNQANARLIDLALPRLEPDR